MLKKNIKMTLTDCKELKGNISISLPDSSSAKLILQLWKLTYTRMYYYLILLIQERKRKHTEGSAENV